MVRIIAIALFLVCGTASAKDEVSYEYKVAEANRLVSPFLKRLGDSWKIKVIIDFVAPEVFDESMYKQMLAKVSNAGALKGCSGLNVGQPNNFPDPLSNTSVGGVCEFDNRSLAIVVILRVKQNGTEVMAVLVGEPNET
ncbi:MAG: hypothetical protein GY951_01425 [Psychromonas sp.]|nr:hypothetical protein [Psychromonas sp.]